MKTQISGSSPSANGNGKPPKMSQIKDLVASDPFQLAMKTNHGEQAAGAAIDTLANQYIGPGLHNTKDLEHARELARKAIISAGASNPDQSTESKRAFTQAAKDGDTKRDFMQEAIDGEYDPTKAAWRTLDDKVTDTVDTAGEKLGGFTVDAINAVSRSNGSGDLIGEKGKERAENIGRFITDIGTDFIPGVGFVKTAAEQGNEILDAIDGTDHITGEELSGKRRLAKAAGGLGMIALSAIPGMKLAKTGQKALTKEGAKLMDDVSGEAINSLVKHGEKKLIASDKSGLGEKLRIAEKELEEGNATAFGSDAAYEAGLKIANETNGEKQAETLLDILRENKDLSPADKTEIASQFINPDRLGRDKKVADFVADVLAEGSDIEATKVTGRLLPPADRGKGYLERQKKIKTLEDAVAEKRKDMGKHYGEPIDKNFINNYDKTRGLLRAGEDVKLGSHGSMPKFDWDEPVETVGKNTGEAAQAPDDVIRADQRTIDDVIKLLKENNDETAAARDTTKKLDKAWRVFEEHEAKEAAKKRSKNFYKGLLDDVKDIPEKAKGKAKEAVADIGGEATAFAPAEYREAKNIVKKLSDIDKQYKGKAAEFTAKPRAIEGAGELTKAQAEDALIEEAKDLVGIALRKNGGKLTASDLAYMKQAFGKDGEGIFNKIFGIDDTYASTMRKGGLIGGAKKLGGGIGAGIKEGAGAIPQAALGLGTNYATMYGNGNDMDVAFTPETAAAMMAAGLGIGGRTANRGIAEKFGTVGGMSHNKGIRAAGDAAAHVINSAPAVGFMRANDAQNDYRTYTGESDMDALNERLKQLYQNG